MVSPVPSITVRMALRLLTELLVAILALTFPYGKWDQIVPATNPHPLLKGIPIRVVIA